MDLSFKIGHRQEAVSIPDGNLLGVLYANDFSADLTGAAAVRRALDNPIGQKPISQLFHPGETVAIVTSDITRPMPTAQVMPLLLEALYRAGIRKEDITLVFALGSHRKQTEQEQRTLAGSQAWAEIACVDSDPNDCICLGYTSAGTPVDITRRVAQADRRICLGNIKYHYFAGYSGGAKAIMPGVSTRAAIQANHRMMVLPDARAGALDDNPLRRDIEEAGAICGIDFILNVVLNERKEIIYAVAGDPVLAHRQGCAFLDTIYRKEISQPADIVLVGQGGYPKDLNLTKPKRRWITPATLSNRVASSF